MVETRDFTAVEDGAADEPTLTVSGYVGYPTIEGCAYLDDAGMRDTTLFLALRLTTGAQTDIYLNGQLVEYVRPRNRFERVRIVFEGVAVEDLPVRRRA